MEAAAESELDVQAYRRSLALQQIDMLSRLAELGMQLAEGEGARALAAQARGASQARVAEAPAQAAEPGSDAPAPAAVAQQAGLAFARYARLVQQSLAQRARAADGLCARDKVRAAEREAGRETRRDRHRDEVEHVMDCLISDAVEDDDIVDDLKAELAERIEELYEDEVRVEDRPLGSVMSGLACGLGLSEEWHRHWAAGWPSAPRPARPAGSPAAVLAERARRRGTVAAAVERTIAAVPDPARTPGLRAGLAVRLREADVGELLDTECTAIAADRLCRSLGLGPYIDVPDSPDTG